MFWFYVKKFLGFYKSDNFVTIEVEQNDGASYKYSVKVSDVSKEVKRLKEFSKTIKIC